MGLCHEMVGGSQREALCQLAVGLFPLLTLTKGGKRSEIVQTMVDRLAAAGEWNLLAASRVVGGLVFRQEREREWFKRRFLMVQDVLRESWVYQEIGQEFLEEGRKEELQRRRQGIHDAIMALVQTHFPELVALARQQINSIPDPDVLQRMLIKLIAAQQTEEVKEILLAGDRA
jgi:predicted transposase YdaD